LLVASVIAAVAASAAPASALVWPDVPERVERHLASPDAVTRRGAARDIATLGAARGGPLALRAFEDSDSEVRIAAAESAIRLRIPEATVAVLPWLGGGVPSLRQEACEVARALPDPHAVPALARALGDAEAPVRVAAASALGAQVGNGDAVSALLGKLDDGSPAVRIVIAQSLARLGDARAVVPLVGKVQDSVPEVREAVAHALGDLGDTRATQALILQLRDTVAEVRGEALASLGKLRAPDAVDTIAPLAVDHNASLRQGAVTALGRIATGAAVRALVALLGTGDDAGGGLERTPVREALVAAGRVAILPVAAVLDRGASPAAAASAAWVLGELHAHDQALAIVAAMRRGALGPSAALHAIAGAGTSDSLPVVLEFASDPDPAVRQEALEATAALLDPARPDGRAAEPLAAALTSPSLAPSERAFIAKLLGRTGAARAAPVLAALAREKGAVVRLAAIDALGTLGPEAVSRSEDFQPLVDALGDADPGVRLHAAVALADSGGANARDALVLKLDTPEIDRGPVLTALGGILSRAPSDGVEARLVRELEIAAGPDRDAVAEALGRAKGLGPVDALAKLASGADVGDARTAAILLGAHQDDPRARTMAVRLLTHPDAGVRAQAAWSLGTLGAGADVGALVPLLARGDEEAIDAAAAIGRIAGREKVQALAASLCPALTDVRPLVRASALAGLSLGRARCGDGATERRALREDPVDAVRAAAALAIGRDPLGDADARALTRCAMEDRSGSVAARCRTPAPAPTDTHAVTIYVLPDLATAPQPGAPYVLVLADGSLRAGSADRRGAVFDPNAPEGEVQLLRVAER
jgi:HEAT repeat protein